MTTRRFVCSTLCCLLWTVVPGRAQDQPLVGDPAPRLRLEAGGPTSFVTSLAFSPEGQTLYAAGFDKVVRTWALDRPQGRYILQPTAYRVPIGPGLHGAINTIALSEDGVWLALAGRGVVRGDAGFAQPGFVVPAAEMSDTRYRDQGTIWLYHTQTRAVRQLRGHLGEVLTLAFAPLRTGKPPLLVSAAGERGSKPGTFAGAVRLWEVDRGVELDHLLDLPDPNGQRPGLACWHRGEGLRQLRVALAWPAPDITKEGQLHLWDLDRPGTRPRAETDGTFNNVLAFLPDAPASGQGTILTGSFWKREGYLQGWRVPGEQGPQQEKRRATFAPVKDDFYLPRALALFSARAGGPVDRAAVVLRVARPPHVGEYVLGLVTLGPTGFQRIGPLVPLWQGDDYVPVLAVTPAGRLLAVAGNASNDILLFALDRLLEGKPARQQVLRGHGLAFRSAAFVSDGKERGLLLGERARGTFAPPAPGDLLFTFSTKPRLTTEHQGWQIQAPRVADGTLEYHPPTAQAPRPSFRVRQRDGTLVRTTLEASQSVDAYALLPAGPFAVSVLAVASRDEQQQPTLTLFDAAAGKEVRRLTGHQGLVRSLAFAPDGQLLVSTADDQTVCVWSLHDFDRVVRQRGRLRGVAVEAAPGGGIALGRIEADSPARDSLRRGWRVQAILQGKQEQSPATPLAFYEAVFRLKPGTQATLRVRDTQGQVRDVTLPVEQGVDERKPLLSLFVTRAAAGAAPEWVAWNPVGPYEASGPAAEKQIGWHRNTGKPQEPTLFVPADQYRKEYHRPGILPHLLARGSVGTALRDWEEEERRRKDPPAPPTLTVLLSEDGVLMQPRDGQLLLRQQRATLHLVVTDYEREQIDTAEWQLNGGELAPLTPQFGGEWSADLSQTAWKRGPHKLGVVVRTREVPPRQYRNELTFAYVPRPPEVELKPPASRIMAGANFTAHGTVRPGLPGQSVQIRLLHKQQDKIVKQYDWDTAQPRQIEAKLDLLTGVNLIEVIAVNQHALPDNEGLETIRKSFEVVRPRQKVSPPVIALHAVTHGTADRQELAPGQALVVRAPQVRLLGKITAAANLSKASWNKVGSSTGHPLTGFVPDSRPDLDITEQLTLEPGVQKLRLTAHAGGESAEAVVTLDYRPRLPELSLTSPVEDATLYLENERHEVLLEGRLIFPADRRAFQAVVLVNGQELATRPTIDEAAQTLTLKLLLGPGDNRIQVRLSNAWKETATVSTRVTCRRPPRVVKFEPPQVGDRPFIDLVAQVESARELRLDAAEFLVEPLRDGTARPGRRIAAKYEPAGPDVGPLRTWKVFAAGIPLEPGANRVQLLVSNADGWCREPGVLKQVVYRGQPAPKADIEILDPREDQSVHVPKRIVRFRVRSSSPLRLVELRRGPVLLFAAPVAELRQNAAGLWETTPAPEVELTPGVNPLRVVAVNDGGEVESAPVTVSYVDQPVRIVIDRVESLERVAEPLKPAVGANQQLVFTKSAATGRVKVHGFVTWLDRTDPRLEDGLAEVRVWVNGFRQPSVALEPRVGKLLTRKFEVAILLSRAEHNVIEIDLPAQRQEAASRRQFTLHCARPEPKQRLHLLIVALGKHDPEKLRDRVLDALQATARVGASFKTPAFAEGQLYGVLTSSVSHRELGRKLELMRLNMRPSRGGPTNEVLLLYYHGGESVEKSGPFLWSDLSADRQPALTRAKLTTHCTHCPGVNLLLLDVARAADAAGNPGAQWWTRDCRFGVLRHGWQDNASVPREARLLGSLGEALSRQSRLKDVADWVHEEIARQAKQHPQWGVSSDGHVPEGLEELVIGRKR